MYLEIKENDGILTGFLSGYIDTATANRAIEIDCSQLDYISSSGLRLLLSLRKQVAADGGSLVIKNINDEIRKVFTLTGFFKLFDIR